MKNNNNMADVSQGMPTDYCVHNLVLIRFEENEIFHFLFIFIFLFRKKGGLINAGEKKRAKRLCPVSPHN